MTFTPKVPGELTQGTKYQYAYREKHPETFNAYQRGYRRKHSQEANDRNAKWRAKRSPEQIERDRIKMREWRHKNRDRFNAACDAARHRLKVEVIREYGGKCECCAEFRYEFLSIDHIDGTGHLHKKELNGRNLYRWLKMNGYPKDNFRLLCMNCNFALGKIGYCPHQGMKMFIDSVAR